MKRSLRTLSTAARTARATPAPCSHLPRPSAFASSRAFSSTPAKALATVSDLELAKDLKITGDEPLHVAPAADMLGFEVSETQPAGGADVGRPIYLDAQATTPTDPRVLDAMLPYMTNQYGNPHSKTHAYGWETEKAVEQGRQVRFLWEFAAAEQREANALHHSTLPTSSAPTPRTSSSPRALPSPTTCPSRESLASTRVRRSTCR